MNKQEITFRGLEVTAFRGVEKVEEKENHFYYGIRKATAEDIPLAIEILTVGERWGTLETTEPIAFDGKSVEEAEECDFTHLQVREAMAFMNYLT